MSKRKRRSALGRIQVDRRLTLLRAGNLTAAEIADFVADVGRENYIEAEQEVNQLLDHPSPLVRFNALATLAYEWGRTSRLTRIYEIALNDPDRECRRQAAGALGSLSRGTLDRDTIGLLVKKAKDRTEQMDVRAFAYTAALDVLGVSRAMQPNPIGLKLGPNELLALDDYLKMSR